MCLVCFTVCEGRTHTYVVTTPSGVGLFMLFVLVILLVCGVLLALSLSSVAERD